MKRKIIVCTEVFILPPGTLGSEKSSGTCDLICRLLIFFPLFIQLSVGDAAVGCRASGVHISSINPRSKRRTYVVREGIFTVVDECVMWPWRLTSFNLLPNTNGDFLSGSGNLRRNNLQLVNPCWFYFSIYCIYYLYLMQELINFGEFVE